MIMENMSFNLTTIDWTAISAVVSFLMVLITFFTLKQNKKQMQLIQAQWIEEHKPLVRTNIFVSNDFFYLNIQNNGKTDLTNCTITLHDKGIDTLNNLIDMTNHKGILWGEPFDLLIGSSRTIPLCLWREYGNFSEFNFTITSIKCDFSQTFQVDMIQPWTIQKRK